MLYWRAMSRATAAGIFFAGLLLLLGSWAAVRADDAVLAAFPLVLEAGASSSPRPGEVQPARASEAHGLADLPFQPERGYGYVGGTPGGSRGVETSIAGGDPAWPAAWREGVEKYVFRVPRGTYIVELTFLETEVCHSGLRVFDVEAEGRELFSGVDIAARGGDFAWVTLAGRASVYDGWLDLRFVSRAGSLPPRVSRVRLLPAPAATAELGALPAPRVSAVGGPAQVLLRWSAGPAGGASLPASAGFGVFRAESPEGPYDSLTQLPISALQFTDAPPIGRPWYYRVRAFAEDGSQGPLSEPLAATAEPAEAFGLRVYDLRIPEPDVERMSRRSDPAVEAAGELHFLNQVDYVLASYDTTDAGWRRKKSWHLFPLPERNRRVLRRRSVFLSAEAGDPTLLREIVSANALTAAGLATPAVEPVVLLLNGTYQGLYFDIEQLDRRFRIRTRLDRVGLLALETRGDVLRGDWMPYGEQRGEEGNIASLTDLVHELNRLGTGETGRFFEDRWYLPRLLDRFAFRLLRGARADATYLLQDSRNGKWEPLEARQPDGSWGIRDFQLEPLVLGAQEDRSLLWGRSLREHGRSAAPISVLETRLLDDPARRRMLLGRLSAMLEGALTPAKFDAIVDQAFARVEKAARCDPNRWPRDDGSSIPSAPGRLKAAFRQRSSAARRLLEDAASAEPSPVLISEILPAPPTGKPWIELWNCGNKPVELGELGWTAGLEHGAAIEPLPTGKALEPGERRIFESPEGAKALLSASGGCLALWRSAESALLDVVFYGAATPGISYGRRPPSGEWEYLASPTPAAPNEVAKIDPPPSTIRQGIRAGKEGEATFWIKTRTDDAPGEKRPAKVLLRFREELADAPRDGSRSFQTVELPWNDKTFEHTATLAANPQRKRTAYYYTLVSPDGVERPWPLPAPHLTFILPEPCGLKINEVLPRPQRGTAGPGEFIEVYNPSDQPVDLQGFFLSDSQRNPTRWRIPVGTLVQPKGFAVFYADGRNRGEHAGFRLSNSGEFLGLFGRIEEGNLLVDGVAFRGLRTGESWGASPDGSKNFRAWKDPTPGARNLPKVPREYLEKKKREAEAAAAGGAATPVGSGDPGAAENLHPQEPSPPPAPPPDDDDEDEDLDGEG